VLEVQEHLETFFYRKDHALECLDSVKTSCKLALFSEVDPNSTVEGGSSSGTGFMTFDPATTELLLDLGRSLYKLMFQLLLLIESHHKISLSVVNNFRHNEKMQDMSELFMLVRGAVLRCIDDAELESLDTSTSTEGEHTPTPSPGLPMNNSEFETSLNELIDAQKWSSAITQVRQFKRISQLTSSNPNISILTAGNFDSRVADELSIILNIYSQKIIKDGNDTFIFSKTETELSEVYSILSENLYHVSSALLSMESNMKSYPSVSSNSSIKEGQDTITNL